MNIHDQLTIREKRTFVARLKCSCGKGEYQHDTNNTCEDIFGTFFAAMNNETVKLKHKCTACGDIKEFVNSYPLSLEFEIGIDAQKEDIVKYCSKQFHDKLKPDLQTLGYIYKEDIEETEN